MIEIVYDDVSFREHLPVLASADYLGVMYSDPGWMVSDSFAVPFAMRSRLGFRRLVFPFQPVTLGRGFSREAEYRFLNAMLDAARGLGADCVVHSPMHALFQGVPDGGRCAPCLTYRVDLTPEPDMLLKAMQRNYRQGIRRAAHDGVEVRVGPDELDACYEVFVDTQERNGVAAEYSLAEMRQLRERLGDRLLCAAAWQDGRIHAGSIMAGDRHGAWALAAGSGKHPHQGAVRALYWEAMQEFRRRGAPFFDFAGGVIAPESGSKHARIQAFKARFGAKVMAGCLWKATLRPMRCRFYGAHRCLATPRVERLRRGRPRARAPRHAREHPRRVRVAPACGKPCAEGRFQHILPRRSRPSRQGRGVALRQP